MTALAMTSGCSALSGRSSADAANAPVARRIEALLPADVLLLGERHDAAGHQQLERQTVEVLAARAKLAALAIEMADAGNRTAYLKTDATEEQVKTALSWDDQAWPWAAYGPVVMAAVRAGVPVFGANLPRDRMKVAMADVSLDAQLLPAALKTQQEAVRAGHCNFLPETQIGPMTRVQVARDREMALIVAEARQPGKTVLLVSGAGHAERAIGVPQHLATELKVKTVRMAAGEPDARPDNDFDAIWHTPALPAKDYCAELRRK